MKQYEPNALRRELARSQQVGPHPDADVLTAFTEDALPERERKQLIAHLAVCADCREVLSFATSATPELVTDNMALIPSRPVHPPLRTWLQWLATAAGVVIVSSAVLLHERKREFEPRSENNASVATTPTVRAPAQPAKQMQTTITPAPTPLHNKPAPGPVPKAIEPAQQSLNALIPSEDREASKTSEVNRQNPTAVVGAIAGAMPTAAIPRAPEANPVAPPRSMSAFSAMSKTPRLAETQSVNAVRSHWRINGSGQAERSMGDSAWQAVLQEDKSKMRVVAVFGNDVWIGGEDLRLYHSPDNGTTWSLISLPGKASDGHAITHVVFQTPEDGMVEADNGVSWTTIDGGKTWN